METKRFFIYVKARPRTIALVPIQAISSQNGVFLTISVHNNDSIKVKIEYEIMSRLSQYTPLDLDSVHGCLGILDYQNDTHIFFITRCQPVCSLAQPTGRLVFRVSQVISLSLNDPIFDTHAVRRALGNMVEDPLHGEIDTYGISNPCVPMMEFLESGAFYFSPHFDITRSMQSQRLCSIAVDDPEAYEPDTKFQWNHHLLRVFADYRTLICSTNERLLFDSTGYAVSVIQGSVVGDSSGVFVVSRTSSLRSGMRFLTRGVDDEGNVANDVETETIVVSGKYAMSHVQVRGSIPVFWSQEGLQIGSHRVNIARSSKATLPATKRHFADLLDRYKRVDVVNLVKSHRTPEDSAMENGTTEADIGQFYQIMVEAMGLPQDLVSYTAFDYHYEVRNGQSDRVHELIRSLRQRLDELQYYLVDNQTQSVRMLQRGVLRTNCLDCLDRTNIVQSTISRDVLGRFQSSQGMDSVVGQLWRENGNAISRSYTGTGALKSDITSGGKSGWAGFLSDASKSLSRLVQNNFQDRGKQTVIDTLLGSGDSGLVSRPVLLYDPYGAEIRQELDQQLQRVSRTDTIHIMLCTYNLHGNPYQGEPLGSWLAMPRDKRPDFVAVGFQEVVNLDVQSVIAADTANRRTWERVLTEEINRQYRKSFGQRAEGEYALVSSEQLVGVALLFFAHESAFPQIHNLQMVKHKTGLSGMAGNKGCVAMHMKLDDTSICIVAAHLASGATNVNERNSDFHAIRQGTRFQGGQHIDDHDYVFWLGDLNYRLDLSYQQACQMVAQNQIKSLLLYDQLSMQMEAGKVFRGYREAEVGFPPTYKFDVGTDTYDTSEKMRVPSWTDRIMYRGGDVRALEYYRDEVRLSDHKPVLAMMQFKVVYVDKTVRRQIARELYKRHRDSKVAEQRLIDLDLSPHIPSATLPPPSSDTQAWWDNDVGLETKQLNRINPFVTKVTAQLPSDRPKANLIDQKDPFADDTDISWKPIKPL